MKVLSLCKCCDVMGVPVNLHGLRVSAGQVALPGNLNQGLDIPFDLKGPRQVSRDVQPGRHDGSSFRGPGPPGRQVSPVGIEGQAREARGIGLLGQGHGSSELPRPSSDFDQGRAYGCAVVQFSRLYSHGHRPLRRNRQGKEGFGRQGVRPRLAGGLIGTDGVLGSDDGHDYGPDKQSAKHRNKQSRPRALAGSVLFLIHLEAIGILLRYRAVQRYEIYVLHPTRWHQKIRELLLVLEDSTQSRWQLFRISEIFLLLIPG